MKKTLRVRSAMTSMLAAAGAGVSHDALAQSTCSNPGIGENTPFSVYSFGSDPTYVYCNLPFVMYNGPGAAVLAQDVSSPHGNTQAVVATSLNNMAIYATSGGTYTLYGLNSSSSAGGVGTVGYATNGIGVNGHDGGDGTGVYGESATQYGVQGRNDDGSFPGVFGFSGDGASGHCTHCGTGVEGIATGGYGVFCTDSTTGAGVYGSSSTGNGVRGTSRLLKISIGRRRIRAAWADW